MDGAMFTLDWPQGTPTLAQAAQALHVQPSDLDGQFGVRLIDPERNTYTVLCRTDACSEAARECEGVQGPFSSPRIAPFGPVR